MADAFFDDLICYYDNPDQVQANAFEKYDVNTLVHYLEVCHDEYLNKRIPALLINLEDALKYLPQDSSLHKQSSFLFLEFSKEMKAHFAYEETHLFPYARAISKPNACHLGVQYSTSQFELDHPQLIIDAHKLLQFLAINKAAFEANIAYDLLVKRLQGLETDINLHEILEETVLLPKLKRIEEEKINQKK